MDVGTYRAKFDVASGTSWSDNIVGLFPWDSAGNPGCLLVSAIGPPFCLGPPEKDQTPCTVVDLSSFRR
jgi:hypothetical protein